MGKLHNHLLLNGIFWRKDDGKYREKKWKEGEKNNEKRGEQAKLDCIYYKAVSQQHLKMIQLFFKIQGTSILLLQLASLPSRISWRQANVIQVKAHN